jgi:hypothetical protein
MPAERRSPPEAVERGQLPGQRADLPAGTIRRTPPEPQGDENRDQPPNAPTGPEPVRRVPPPQPPARS